MTLANANETSTRVILLVRLHNQQENVLYFENSEHLLPPEAEHTVSITGSVPADIAARGVYWTIDVSRAFTERFSSGTSRDRDADHEPRTIFR